MIKVFKNLIVALFIILCIIFMIIETENVISGVKIAIMLWATRVFPVLFPFFIITSLAVRYGVAHFIGNLIKPITNFLFRTSSISGFVFIMSLLSGNPSSAIIISQLYEDHSISKDEAQHLLSFSVFINPIFCIGTIGIAYFHNVTLGYIILISHILSNVLIGIIMRFSIKQRTITHYSLKDAYEKMVLHKSRNKNSFGETITTIVQNGMNTMFLIGGFMIFYNLIIVMIQSSQVIPSVYPYLHYVIPIQYNTFHAFFVGIFEMVLGVDNVVNSQFSLRLTVTFITMLISFGGLSIHSQIQSILLKVKLKYLPFLLSRLSQMVFSGIIAYYLFPLMYHEKTSTTISIPILSSPSKDKYLLLVTIIIMLVSLLILLKKHKQVKKLA